MDQWKDVANAYLSGLPPILAGIAVAALFGLKHWITTKADFAGDKALGAVSSGYKALSDAQQARIAQQDGEITQSRLQNAALQEQLNRASRENAMLQTTITGLEVRNAELFISLNKVSHKKGPSVELQLIAPAHLTT